MLDISLVREQDALVRQNEQKRNRDPHAVADVLAFDLQWRAQLKKNEALKHTRNVVSQEINQLKKAKNEAEARKKIKEMKKVVEEINRGEEAVMALLRKRDDALSQLGNILHPAVPQGKGEVDNKEIKAWGKKTTVKAKTHVELLEGLQLADFDASAATSGNGFYFLKNELGLLNQALIRFAINSMHHKGYEYIEPPLLIRKNVLGAALDVQEWEKTIYSVEGEDLALIGTSEHALLGMHTNTLFEEKELPKRYFSYSMCFRKEVGAHGINEKGLWRTHQFNKVEQFLFCRPEESEKYFDELLKNSEEILKKLGLPYRVIEICSGELSLWKHRQFDLEVWRPTTKHYGEVMSLSNCTDYQARTLGIKVGEHDGKRRVVHTLNNTALATSRIMVAILENFQTAKGTVKVPPVLVPYMNGVKEIGKK